MRRNVLFACLIALCASLTGFEPARASTQVDDTDGSNLFVVLGGNGTCRRRVMSPVVPGLINAKLFDAFNGWFLRRGLVRSQDNVIYACYEWLSPQMQFYDLHGEGQMIPIHENQLDEVVVSRAQNVTKVVIIGHSHAGWRAMKLASSEYMLNSLQVPVVLATMDPVSRVTCQRVREPGCREAPRDITPEEFDRLHTRTTWFNIYHTPAAFLGSGPMAAAHYNQWVPVNHISMENDRRTWRIVTGFVTDNL